MRLLHQKLAKKKLKEDQLKRKEERKEIVYILRKYKWLVPRSMPTSLFLEIVKTAKLKGNHRAKINKLFIEYFSYKNFETLLNLVEKWRANPLFRHRMKIFHDCVAVLRDTPRNFNPSNVILPTLITQVDGILSDFARQFGIRTKRKDKRKWDEDFRNISNYDKDDESLGLGNDVLLDILFQTAYPEQLLKTPFSFNRHKILHGEFTKYGRLDNTLRAFLILDFLHLASTKGKT